MERERGREREEKGRAIERGRERALTSLVKSQVKL